MIRKLVRRIDEETIERFLDGEIRGMVGTYHGHAFKIQGVVKLNRRQDFREHRPTTVEFRRCLDSLLELAEKLPRGL